MSSLSSSSQVNRDAVTSIDSAPKASLRGKNSGNASDNDQFEREARQMEINSYMVLGTRFDIDARYSILDSVGQGAYGIVCAARDDKEDTVVAIKKMEKIFEHATFTKRTLRELIILRKMQHENVIGLKTILRPINPHVFEEIYVVFELMETDLA